MNRVQITKTITAAALPVIGILAFVQLKISGVIGETSLVILIGILFVVSLIIVFQDRVLSFSLRDLKVELAKVESTRKEVEQREQEVRRIATTLAEITTFFAAFGRRYGGEQDVEVQWLSKKINMMLDGIHLENDERERIFQYLEAMRKVDELSATDKKAAEAVWNATWEKLRDEARRGE